ncbi:hypothetical protein TI04_02420 [Achromatium sp. WMS2]|nr:hypothetical protein TI04_02420 [Achromatium sp. WMS2]
MNIKFLLSIIGLVCSLGFITPGLAADAVVGVEGAFVRAVPPGQPNTAAYMVLTNPTATDQDLVRAESSVCDVVELHTHIMEDGMMKMRAIPKITVPANGQVALQPGGLHVMLIGLKAPLALGEKVAVTLVYADGSQQTVEAPVEQK